MAQKARSLVRKARSLARKARSLARKARSLALKARQGTISSSFQLFMFFFINLYLASPIRVTILGISFSSSIYMDIISQY